MPVPVPTACCDPVPVPVPVVWCVRGARTTEALYTVGILGGPGTGGPGTGGPGTGYPGTLRTIVTMVQLYWVDLKLYAYW